MPFRSLPVGNGLRQVHVSNGPARPTSVRISSARTALNLRAFIATESERRVFVRCEGHGGDLIVVATQRGQLKMRLHIPQLRGAVPAARRDQIARGRESKG